MIEPLTHSKISPTAVSRPEQLVGPAEQLPFVGGDADAHDPVDEVPIGKILAADDRARRRRSTTRFTRMRPIGGHRLGGPVARSPRGRSNHHRRCQVPAAPTVAAIRSTAVRSLGGGALAAVARAARRCRPMAGMLARRRPLRPRARLAAGGPILLGHGGAGQPAHGLEVVAPRLGPRQSAEQAETAPAPKSRRR